MLELKNIKKSFGGTEVLKNVGLSVAKGDVVAILGPSGSGKTTLLRIANFLETADDGEMNFEGEVLDLPKVSHRDAARIRRKTGFVFQNYNLFRNLTALENVTEGLRVVHKLSAAEAERIGRECLEKVGMSDRADHYPSQLSGGQQQRVGIARAFVSSPKVIFADEPTGNLDSRTSKQVLYRMLEMSKNSGVTFVMVTHEPDLAECADRIVTILDGKVCSNVVQDEETKKKNRDALFADLEGNLDIGGEAAKEQKK